MAKPQQRLPASTEPKLGRVDRRIARALALLRERVPAGLPERLLATVEAIVRFHKEQAGRRRPLDRDEQPPANRRGAGGHRN
jgi:hypothetical protein